MIGTRVFRDSPVSQRISFHGYRVNVPEIDPIKRYLSHTRLLPLPISPQKLVDTFKLSIVPGPSRNGHLY
jgi:hypothetical protein